MSYKKAGHLLNPLRRLILSPAKLAGRLPLRADANVLELGPGPGYFSGAVAQSLSQGKLTLVDVQWEMLELAQKRLDSLGIKNVSYVQADATDLPFDKGTFDLAFLVSVLGEVGDREKCILEMHRILRPKGLLSITEHFGTPHAIPLEKIKELVEDKFLPLKFFGKGCHYTANFSKEGSR